jgi:hypothetical protein
VLADLLGRFTERSDAPDLVEAAGLLGGDR